MKKKPHHSTVFRQKATKQISQLQNQVNVLTETNRSLQLAVRSLEDDRRPLDAKLSAMATKLAAVEEARNNLLTTVDEDQTTIDRLTASLREIYEATIGVVMDPEMDPAIQALNSVKDQMAHSERLAKGLTEANAKIESLGSDVLTLRRNHESALAAQAKFANCLARIHQIATGKEVPSGLSTPDLCVEVGSAVMALEEDNERLEGRLSESSDEIKRVWERNDALSAELRKSEKSYVVLLVVAVSVIMVILLAVIYNVANR